MNDIIDVSSVIQASSLQLNADDLIGGAITIKIAAVKLTAGEQPVSIHYEGDNGKPWKPCKSMMRILVNAWGKDGAVFVGRSLTLYRDDKVTWAGMAVGGIRISHMSDISGAMTIALTASRGKKNPYVVKPLIIEKSIAAKPPVLSEIEIAELKQKGIAVAHNGTIDLDVWKKGLTSEQKKALGKDFGEELSRIASEISVL